MVSQQRNQRRNIGLVSRAGNRSRFSYFVPPSSRLEPLFFAPKPVRPLMLIDARYLDYFARLETVGGEREEGGKGSSETIER